MRAEVPRGVIPDFILRPNPDIYLTGVGMTFDFETDTTEKGNSLVPENGIVITSWKMSDESEVKYLLGGELELRNCQQFEHDLHRADFLIAQNAKFELKWLQRAGFPTHRLIIYDTMIAEYVWLGNRKGSKDLDSLARKYEVPILKDPWSVDAMSYCSPRYWPEEWLIERNVGDVRATEEIWRKQARVLKGMNLLPVLYNRCMFTPVLADVEMTGMNLDKQLVLKEVEEIEDRLAYLEKELRLLCKGANLNSKPQLKRILYLDLRFKLPLTKYHGYSLTPAGEKNLGRCKPGERELTDEEILKYVKCDKQTLLDLTAVTKEQKKFLELLTEYNKLRHRHGTYTSVYKGSVEKGDGKIYAQFNQVVTGTHRLSSSKYKDSRFYSTQLQNIERQLKKLFKPRYKGWKIGEVDLEGAEFRAAALLAKDRQAIADILNKDFDVHVCSYNEMHQLGLKSLTKDQITSEQRDSAKSCTFGPLYGKSNGDELMLRWIAAFRKRWSGIYKMQLRWEAEVMRTDKLVTPWGLIFYYPDYNRHTYIKGRGRDAVKMYKDFPSVCNYTIQNLATAEINPIGMRIYWQYLKELEMRSFLVNTVHDSAISEIHPDEEEMCIELMKESYKLVDVVLKNLYEIEFELPMAVDVGTWSNWKKDIVHESKEVK